MSWLYNLQGDQALGETGAEEAWIGTNEVAENYTDYDATDLWGDDHSAYMEHLAHRIVADMHEITGAPETGTAESSNTSDESSSSSGFSDGERVTPTANLNTRYRPGTESRLLDTMAPGTVGEIMNGPETEDGYTWWGIHWLDADIWGWSAGQYLESTDSDGGDGGGGDGGNGGGKPPVQFDQAASGNYEPANRTPSDIRWTIIHTIEGSYETGISVFNNPSSGVSAHYVVGNDAGQLTQMVADSDIAYTAGNYDYNATGLNFENEGFAAQSHPDSLYQNAAAIVSWVCEEYNIPKEHPSGIAPADPADGSGVIGHNQVPDPENPSLGGGISNHTDPGDEWDWEYFMSML